jgi:transcriptional regulator with GAF, ATPase, and Fis domain
VILLLADPEEVDLGTIARLIEGHEVAVCTEAWKATSLPRPRPSGVTKYFLISSTPGVMSLGEHVSMVREEISEEVPLVVCGPRPTVADREVLRRCGATDVITPADWRPVAVADRVLAELALMGLLQPSEFGSLAGATPGMRELYHKIEVVAPLDEPVLLLGETGTGKELVTAEIHRCSGRSGQLLSINCAALTPDLLESELFGHERGAFSGAVTSRKGLLVEAGHGTVLLDEIGDLALSSQAKLLRVIEERKVRPVGANHWQPVHARVVLATNRDLEAACAASTFRNDLFFRISGFTLALPPLRERKPDLLLLAHRFLDQYNHKYSRAKSAPPGCLDPLFRYEWPGNVRELGLAIWQAAAYSSGDHGDISAMALLEWSRRGERTNNVRPESRRSFETPTAETWKEVLERTRATYFQAVLRAAGGNKEAAARIAGVSRSQLYEILKHIEDTNEKRS